MQPSPQKLSARPTRTQLRLNNLITIVLGLALFVFVNYLGYRHYVRKDLSKGNYFQLSEKTINILKALPEPVKITTFLLNSTMQSEIENLLKEYQYYGGKNIQIERVDPALKIERAEAIAKKFNFDSRENLVIFEYKDQHKYVNDSALADLDTSMSMMGQPPRIKAFKGEQQFTQTIQALVEGKPSKVYFLSGHGEREIGNVSTPGAIGELESRIKRDNNLTAPLNLSEVGAVPEDCDALIIAGPRVALAPPEVAAINDYLDKGGKVVLLQDPVVVSGLETMLPKFGLELPPSMIIGRTNIQGMGDMLIATALGVTYAEHPSVNSIRALNLQMANARPVAMVKDGANPNVAKVTLLVKTPAGFWGETNLKDKKPTFDPATDIAGPLAMAALYDGGEVPGEGVKVTGARFAVVGCSSFLANQNLDPVGLDFFLNLLNWMMKKEASIGISPKAAQEFSLTVSPLQQTTITLLVLGLIPILSIVTGFMVWFSRRK